VEQTDALTVFQKAKLTGNPMETLTVRQRAHLLDSQWVRPWEGSLEEQKGEKMVEQSDALTVFQKAKLTGNSMATEMVFQTVTVSAQKWAAVPALLWEI
jgi:hypothetical protein